MLFKDMTEQDYKKMLDNFVAEPANIDLLLNSANFANHTDKHITPGLEEAHELMNKVRQNSVMTFYDKEQMKDTIQTALMSEIDDNSQWNLADWYTSEVNKPYVLQIHLYDNTGIQFERSIGTDSNEINITENELMGVTLYLNRDDSSPVGFSIYTAYPDLDKQFHSVTRVEPLNIGEKLWAQKEIAKTTEEKEHQKQYNRLQREQRNKNVIAHEYDLYKERG